MKIFFGVVIVLACVILAILALPFLVDLNSYQDQYRPLLEQALNRKVSIQNIRLMIVPRLGVRVQGVTVMDDPNFSPAPFASLSSFEIGVKLGPLLRQRIEVEEVVLHNPVIAVVREANGKLNVSTLGKPSSETSASSGPSSLLGLLAVDVMTVMGGKVTYSDRSGEQSKEYALANLEVILRSVRVGQVAGLHLATLVQPLDLPVTIEGSFGPIQDTLALEDLDFAVRMGDVVSNIKGSFVAGSLKLGVTSQIINSADLPPSLGLTKPVKVHNLDVFVEALYPPKEGVPIQDTIKEAKLEFDLELGNSALLVAGGGKAGDFHLVATADSIYTADIPIALQLSKSIQIKDLKFDAEAKYPAPDGRPIQDAVSVNTLSFDVVMGNSVMTVKGAGPSADFKLTAASGSLKSDDLPLARAPKEPVEIKDLRLAVEVHQPLFQVASLTFSPFGGEVQGSAAAMIGVKPMPFEGKLTLQNVQLEPVVEILSTSPITMSGTAGGQLAVKGNGMSFEDLTSGLTGAGRVTAKDGTLRGINLLKEAGGLAQAFGLPVDASNVTAFDTLDTTFHIDQGQVYVDRFQLQGRLLEVSATGTIGFDQSLNLKTKITPSGRRITVPMLVGGTLQAPTYALDTNAVGAGLRKVQDDTVRELLKGEKPDELLKQRAGNLKKLFVP